MKTKEDKHEIVNRLKRDLLQWQGAVQSPGSGERLRLGRMDEAFPGGEFPVRAVHEFLCGGREESAATSGFVSGLLSRLMDGAKVCLWIGTHRAVFPAAVKTFHIPPENVLFVEMSRQKDVLWAVEEALKYKGLAAVVGELQAMNFVQSRRLQLAVERSGVTAFILRHLTKQSAGQMGTTASTIRWRIRPLPSVPVQEGLPGVGFPRWEAEMLKVRNGNPGRWKVEWRAGRFVPVAESSARAGEGKAGAAEHWKRRASG